MAEGSDAAPGEGARGSSSAPRHPDPRGGSDRGRGQRPSQSRAPLGGTGFSGGTKPFCLGRPGAGTARPRRDCGIRRPRFQGHRSAGRGRATPTVAQGRGAPGTGSVPTLGQRGDGPRPAGRHRHRRAAPGSGTGSPGPAELGQSSESPGLRKGPAEGCGRPVRGGGLGDQDQSGGGTAPRGCRAQTQPELSEVVRGAGGFPAGPRPRSCGGGGRTEVHGCGAAIRAALAVSNRDEL